MSLRSRIYHHEDTGTGAKVFYKMQLVDCDTWRPKLDFEIERMENEIYHDSSFEKVLTPPVVMKMQLDFDESMALMSHFVEAISVYMSSIRQRLYQENSLRLTIDLKESKYSLFLHAVNKKHSAKGKGKNSERLVMTLIDKESGDEVIAIKMKKTKIVFLLQMYKTLLEETVPKFSIPYDDANGRRLQIIRNEEYLAIGDIWLHGREINKLQDYIERVIFDFKYRSGEGTELFRYRQVKAFFSDIENVVKINMRKFTADHAVWLDEKGEPSETEFFVTSAIVARLYMALPKFTGFDVKDKELLDGERPAETIKDRQEFFDIGRGDFILNTIESQITLSVNREQKFDAKNRSGKLRMKARYRDGILEDPEYQVGKKDEDTGEFVNVKKLAGCDLDLKIDWLYIFALCAEAVHSSEDLRLDDYGRHVHSWLFKTEFAMEEIAHTIKIIADPGNKASAVMVIDRRTQDFIRDDKMRVEQRMRIPLFKEHVRTIIKGMVTLARLYENYYWQKSFPVYSDTDDGVKGEMRLGLRRFTRKGKELVSLGIVGRAYDQIMLTETDRDTLFLSAYNRLLYGRWLQFSGERIAVSFDGWLTDRYHEYRIEFDIEESSGARGSLAALAILFSTVRGKAMTEEVVAGAKKGVYHA